MQHPTNTIREHVVKQIAQSHSYRKIGQVEYVIAGKNFHVKVKSGNGQKYPFNINPTVLRADYEVVICGNEDRYYVLPQELIKEIHSDPHAMPDKRNPGYTIYDMHPQQNKIVFGTGGRSLDATKYKNLKLNVDGNFTQ
jgi:hypothetical protein